ncbi:calponin-like proteiny domain-containing protein isoform X1 [Gossypium australe]|uniref:Calponin-like proteiny domain-containing protein isoform X1 n=1 Tax=Gossypium australe TaxID=47621 RepID=A0A5B6V2P6_9ROSI|nr:calponin-like proteiny domain-containing protein isoform X1 [Gossypium australe]
MEGCTMESINEVQEESQNFSRQIEESNHSEKLCRNAEIECVNNEWQTRHLGDGDLVNEEEMCHRFCMSNISNSDESEDQTLVQVKEREVEAINGLNGVNGDQAAEFKNRCRIGTHSTEVSDKNTSERRTEGFEKQKDGRREPLKEVQEESQDFSGQIGASCHLEKHGEIDNADNERSMVHMDDEKEDQTLVQEKGTEVEDFVGCSGVKGDQANNGEACEQITEGFGEQNKGTRESLEEVQEGQNISDPIEVAEEVDMAKGKPTKVAQKRRGQKRKRQVKTRKQRKVACVLINEGRKESLKEVQEESENFSSPIEVAEEIPIGKLNKVTRKPRGKKRKRQEITNKLIKVLKDDIAWPMMENEKKYVKERQQQMKGRNGVTKSVGEQDQPQRGQMVSEQGSQDPKIDIRTKTLVNPFDGDVKNLKTSPPKRSARLLEKKKKEGLKHEEQRQRKLRERERRSLIVCALPAATQPRKGIDPEARTTPQIDLESMEWGKILLRQLKRPRSRTHANRKGNMAERFTQSEPKLNGTSKNSELEAEKQEPRMKVYVRRKVKKSQLKEPENNIVLSSNLE